MKIRVAVSACVALAVVLATAAPAASTKPPKKPPDVTAPTVPTNLRHRDDAVERVHGVGSLDGRVGIRL